MSSVDMVQFHADKISAPASYFCCYFWWSFSIQHILYCCLIILFWIFIVLSRIFYFLSFSQSIPIYARWSSIILVISPLFYCWVDFFFLAFDLLALSCSKLSFCQVRLYCLIDLLNFCDLFLFVLDYLLNGSHRSL